MNNPQRKNNFLRFVDGAGKKLLTTTAMTAVGFLSMTGNAQAADDWTNHVVTGGGGSIAIDTTIPDTTNITQTGHRVKVSGDGDIKAGWTVNIDQESSSSQYILFDTEADPTRILGDLNADGEVYIFDRDGVIFGNDSQVNVGSIVASSGTLASTDIELDAGKLVINSDPTDGKVENRGSITVAEGGLAAFVAPTVTNHGAINANMGSVVMAAGEVVTLDMYGDGLVEVAIDDELASGLIQNKGTIQAAGGKVIITASIAKDAVDNVINMDGIIDVSSATVKGGKIILSGGSKGKVRVKGSLKANGNGTDAGSIDIKGQSIKVTKAGRINADASEGNAAGTVDVIADETLTIDGKLSAQGLVGTGDIETSAPNVLFGNHASILATRKWLLDPTDIVIDDPMALLIEGQLAVGDMTVQTPAGGTDEGKIQVNSIVNWSTASVFSLIAHDDIHLNFGGGVDNAGGNGDFIADAGDSFRVRDGSIGVLMDSGNISITAANEFTLAGALGEIRSAGGDILIDNGDSFKARANSIRTSGIGTIEINQNVNGDNNTFIGTPLIQNAVDAIFNAGSGTNTVNVGAGTWNESVVADLQNLNLKGANAGTSGKGTRVAETIITPTTQGVAVTEDNVTIDGFSIIGGNNGVKAVNADSLTVKNNIIEGAAENGIKVEGGTLHNLRDNKIMNVGEDGIHVENFGSAWIAYNDISFTGDDGIDVNTGDFVSIYNNYIELAGYESNAPAQGNTNVGSDADGIHVENITGDDIPALDANDKGFGSSTYGFAAEIYDNEVSVISDDGIEVLGSRYVLVDNNMVDLSGDDGIHVLYGGSKFFGDVIPSRISDVSIVDMEKPPFSEAVITNNIVTNSGTPLPEEGDRVFISKKRSGGDGIEVVGFEKILVEGNDVSDSVENGLFVSGPFNGDVVVSDNTFTDNDIGAHFESGQIDLTGEGNVINGGRIGLRFAPAEVHPYYDMNIRSASVSAVTPDPVFADMSLVDNTIGAQTFDGQSSFFVELDNGAFFEPGTPTILRENDSTFVGTPFGTFTPSVDYAGGYPADVLAYLESKFYHFVDDGTLGLFFLEPIAEIDQQDIFNSFDPLNGGLGGLNVTLLGLPNIPGAPASLNNIAPAAGGPTTPEDLNNIETAAGGSSPEDLNDIETAAGGDKSACWGDTLNTAGAGQTATLSYGGSAEDLLNGEASCTSQDI